MKTSIFKLLVPAMVLVTGVVSAFTTNAAPNDSKQASIWGYRKIAGTQPCEQVKMCDQVPNFVCRSTANENLYQLIGPNNCPTLLYHSVSN